MELNHEKLQAMDGICTASSRLKGRMIRLWTARLKGCNGFKEFGRLYVANHFGYLVEMDGRHWMAEPLEEGLRIRSLKEYTKEPDKNRIVAVVRHPIFNNPDVRKTANNFILDKAQETVDYDDSGCPGSFLNLCEDADDKWYCSEMGEDVLNMFGGTWDNWQLKRSGKKGRIAPIEIQLGKNVIPVKDFLK